MWKKHSSALRDFTHHRRAIFFEGGRIARVSTVLLMTFHAEFPSLSAAEKFIVRRAAGIVGRQTVYGLVVVRIDEAGPHRIYNSPCFFIRFLNASRLMPSMRAAWT